MSQLHEEYKKSSDSALKDFFTFLKFQSISTDPAFKNEVKACADWLTHYISDIGFHVEQWTTSGHPVIFASHLEAGPSKPTLLIYNHYDVQPTDPLELWNSPPFEPTVINGEVFARGAQDNKGQCFYVLQALKAYLKVHKKFPLNIKLCIEGEEESGSTGLSKILKEPQRQKQLKADYLAIVDMGIFDINSPAVTLGVRGIVTMEVRALCSTTDLHSGSHGGIVYNPLHALVKILSQLRDDNGKITIPGFYDNVKPLDPSHQAKISLDFDPKQYEKQFGAKPTGGEKEFSILERAWNRPTLEINGITGGYGGAGFKTVIPAKALAKVSCRLVPDQDPQKIGTLVAKHIQSLAPEGIKIEVEIYPGSGKAIRANPDSVLVKSFAKAYETLYNKPCKYIFDGGSIPIVTELANASGSEVILLGFGLPDDQIHAPNEHFGIDRLEKGFLVMTYALEELGKS